jgi:hypothetical protein
VIVSLQPPLEDGNEVLCGNTISELNHEDQYNEKEVSIEDLTGFDDFSSLGEKVNEIPRVKRSSIFDNLQDSAAIEKGETVKNTTSLGIVPNNLWSLLFKSDSSEQTNTGNGNETNNNETTTGASKNKGTENIDSMTSDTAEETIDDLVMESDHQGNRSDGGRQFDMEASKNITQQIQNAEAILQQAILAHHPGETTTEAVWNTDEFISKTSK